MNSHEMRPATRTCRAGAALAHVMQAVLTLTVSGVAVAALAADIAGASNSTHAQWPKLAPSIPRDPAMEAKIAQIIASMTVAQKVGQITQPEIKFITPAQVTAYHIGSVLNGGGTWPDANKRARLTDWLSLADRYDEASMATDMTTKVPIIWGTDAIHGHGNVFGATLFPQNIGLGATHSPELVQKIGTAVGRQVRASGINWVFGPTLAVARNVRWGRTYESFSEDPAVVKAFANAYVAGMQGDLSQSHQVVATAKHFMGDGATDHGRDQGNSTVGRADMIATHAQGYVGALGAGVQTVMASFNSWNDVVAGSDYGKMHGSKTMLTDVLKRDMGFDGFVVSDWNGIGQVPGCSDDSCPQAINAGIDLVMVPEKWQAFIGNTIAQVNAGQIPMARLDDAVARILRVKLRAGMFGKKPSDNAFAGKADALLDRDLARRAVRESLVLLKNNRGVLPLRQQAKILVVGKSAQSLQNQTGGWSLTWQGTDNTNADFPVADTVLGGIVQAAAPGHVTYNETAVGVDISRFDVVVAVIGETPYAEGDGDIVFPSNLRHSRRFPEDLRVLQAVAGKGKPVVTVLMSGRPVYANDLINLSDAFVAAWLPGTEGAGVADVLLRKADGSVNFDFTGRLSFSWPRSDCQASWSGANAGDVPLFRPGYGLSYGLSLSNTAQMGQQKDTLRQADARCSVVGKLLSKK